MPHINLDGGVPGVRSLVLFRPETGSYLYELVQVLLRGPSPLTEGERELIAAFVSNRNNCKFCMQSHAAAARCLMHDEAFIVDDVLGNLDISQTGAKMTALLNIAAKVQVSGKLVTSRDIEDARQAGATDLDIHDTVLIAATFCMFNRYVDGLDTYTPEKPEEYLEMGKRMASNGYVLPAKTN